MASLETVINPQFEAEDFAWFKPLISAQTLQ